MQQTGIGCKTLMALALAATATAVAATGPQSFGARLHAALAGKNAVGKKNSTIPIDGAQGIVLPLGTAIDWSAEINNSNGGAVWYRYRVTTPDGAVHMIRDFGPDPELAWTTIDAEGVYQMELTARKLDSAEVVVDTTTFQFTPLATEKAAIAPTNHPQVFIYSAPPCAPGSTMNVQFKAPDNSTGGTPQKPCTGLNMNFYVAGLKKQTTYQLWHLVVDPSGRRTQSPALTQDSGTPTYDFTAATPVKPAAAGAVNPVMLYASLFEPIHATDLDGNILWYYLSTLTTLTRPDGNGLFWGFAENPALGPDSQIVRQFDLAGSTVLETNAARISEQLVAMGQAPITGFHHEVRSLPNGNILALGSVENILNGVQGDGDVDVVGDMILVLNRNLEVLWAWNAFDYLDPTRQAVLGEICPPGGAGCAPFYKAAQANDWTHGNSLQLTADGNILYSVRHQDWLIKIDYQNGAGTGQILWKMGNGGDFTITSDDPSPWFSHQHDANFDLADPTILYVFDNGNTRQASDSSAQSRGQAFKIDEQARTATPVLNADLGDFSMALGSAIRLPNGNYQFDMGWINTSYGPSSRTVEVDPTGKIVYEIRVPTAFYRTFRLASLYATQ